MKTISDAYRAANAREHEMNDGFGIRGFKHLDKVLSAAKQFGATSVLDYGCGQGSLASRARRVSDIPFRSYDPAVPQFAADPEPADLVACTDVMEHVEPLHLADVLQHIRELAILGVYFEIACRPAKRVLQDGRNAHLIVQHPYFWFDTIRQFFEIIEYRAAPGHGVIITARTEGVE